MLKPLYFDNGKEKTEIGFMYIFNDDYIPYEVSERYFITKPEVLKELTYALWDGKTPTADEAFKALDDKENYETLDKLETEDFYFVTVKNPLTSIRTLFTSRLKRRAVTATFTRVQRFMTKPRLKRWVRTSYVWDFRRMRDRTAQTS